MQSLGELVVDAQLEAVPAARRFASQALAGQPRVPADEIELVVAELVTNAALYGAAPVTLRLWRSESVVRVEVGDAGPQMPILAPRRTDTMTGRGLALVAAMAASWGVDRRPDGGKVVWAELDATDDPAITLAKAPVTLDAVVDARAHPDATADQVFTVRLGAVPTDLLMEAKAHIDNVVRELTLARADGIAVGVPESRAVALLIDTVTNGFAEARNEIKRQALASAERGDKETELLLRLPASAADAADAYRAALDETDRYARAARLLTLAAAPAHKVFRNWYLGALAEQLRAQARGEPARPSPTFAEALAEEVTRLSSLRDSWNRLQLLQKVTGELTGAQSAEEIAAAVTRNAVEFLGALVVRVFLLGDDGFLRLVADHGGVRHLMEHYREFSIDADLPASEVVRAGQPLLLRSRAEIEAVFPPLAGTYPVDRMLHLIPLKVGNHTLGCLTLTFPAGSQIDETSQLSFMTALGDVLAQALERAVAMQRAEEANQRLALLADASVALSASLDYPATADAAARLLVPRLADWCVVHVMESEQLTPVAVRHRDPVRTRRAREMSDRFPVRMEAPAGVAKVVRSGQSELHSEISDELVAQIAVDPDHLAALRNIGMTSGLIVPLAGRGGVFGAMTLIHAESGRRYTPADVPFLEDVARRVALALEISRMFQEQSVRLANVTSVAQAAQHAILAPLPERVGPVALSARYVSAAAEAQVGGDLYEVVAGPGTVRMLIGDVRGKGLTAVRTATIVLGEFRAAAADLADLGAVAIQLDRRLRPYLQPEDFVTALLAQIDDDGRFAVASCGHPCPLLGTDDGFVELEVSPGVPLGLGANPSITAGRLRPGDRLLLYTDGIIEARDSERRFVDLMRLVKPVCNVPFPEVLDRLLEVLHSTVSAELDDDLALLLAEYQGQ